MMKTPWCEPVAINGDGDVPGAQTERRWGLRQLGASRERGSAGRWRDLLSRRTYRRPIILKR